MEIPKVGEGKFILFSAELSTGIILNNDGSRYLQQRNDFYTVIENKDIAFEYARKKVSENGNIEIIIYDGNGLFIEVVRPD